MHSSVLTATVSVAGHMSVSGSRGLIRRQSRVVAGRPPHIQDIVLPAALGLHQNPFPHHCPLMRLAFSSQKINGALHRGYRLHLSGEFPGWTAGAYRAAARRFLECLFATEPCTLRPSNFLDCTRPASRLRGETRAPGRKQINDTISFTSLDWAVPGPQMNETKRFCSHRGGHQFASAGREARPTTGRLSISRASEAKRS
jgi:hypothetical protein